MKILIIKTSSLGDIIHAFPVLQHLRECFPDSQIDWVVEQPFASLVQAHPSLNNTIQINTRKWRSNFLKKEVRLELKDLCRQLQRTRYDLLFDLQANLKSGLINALVTCPKKIGFGINTVHEWPNLFFTTHRFDPPAGKNIRDDYLYLVQSVTKKKSNINQGIKLKLNEVDRLFVAQNLANPCLQGKGPIIMVCTGSNWSNKQLDKTTLLSFLRLIALRVHSKFLLVWGCEEEKKLADELALNFPGRSLVTEKMSLATLQNLMAEVDLVIAMDSLPLHLAATASTPTYSVFGASLASKFKPAGDSHEAFQGQCPYGKVFAKRCPILRTCKTGACIKNIDAEQLYQHFNQFTSRLGWTKINQKGCR